MPIPGLFATGSDGMGGVLAAGASELHYTSASPLIIVDQLGSYAGAPLGSAWIGLTPTDVTDAPGASFTASITFDLTGFDPSTARINGSAAADDGVFLSFNGNDLGFLGGAGSLADFQIDSGFLPGENTISFSVGNSGITGFNPMALLVGRLSGTASIPTPATGMILCGTLGIGAFRRRR